MPLQRRRVARGLSLHCLLGCGAFAVTLWAGGAEVHAHCRTSSCGDRVGAVCDPPQPNDCGVPLFWPSSCVGYSVQKDASAQVDLQTVQGLAAQAFATWSEADCGEGAHPTISAQDLGAVSCAELAYDPETKNANIIVFRDNDWPYSQNGILALTTVTYALDTGKIRDADMELNSEGARFTTGEQVEVDLLSILTHEAGHFLGLAHAKDPEATMRADYPPKSTTLRSLGQDDQNGICAVYPPDEPRGTCQPEPVNGLGDTCGVSPDEEEDGCSAARGPASNAGSGALGVIGALGGVMVWARGARRRRR